MGIKLFLYQIIFSLSVVILFSTCSVRECDSKGSLILDEIKEFNKDTSKFEKDIPFKDSGVIDQIYIGTKKMQERLGMEKIDSSYDNFQIRITNEFIKSGGLQVLSIRLRDSEWTATYHTYKGNQNDTSYANVKRDSMELFPKWGWCQFLNALISQNILKLPTMEKVSIVKNILVADGGICFFEIASRNKYRFYYYYEPDLLSIIDTKSTEGNNVIEIFKIIKDNFNFADK